MTDLKIFAKIIEQEAIEQIYNIIGRSGNEYIE